MSKFNNLSKIIEIVCEYYHLQPIDIQEQTNRIPIVRPRQIIWHITRNLLDKQICLRDLGLNVGNRKHDNVISGIKSIQNMIDTDKNFKFVYDLLYEKCDAEIFNKSRLEEKENDFLKEIEKFKDSERIQKAIKEIINEF